MGVVITLRKNKGTSYYKEMIIGLLDACHTEGNKVLLCSGYYQQSDYSACGYGVITGDKKSTGIIIPEKDHNGLTLEDCIKYSYDWVLAGIKGDDKYLNYENFIQVLRHSGRTVKAYKSKSKNWHAKVFMILKDDKPIVCIIGSSNMTGPAFGTEYTRFNHETDVLIWDEIYDGIVGTVVNGIDEKNEIIKVRYVAEDNGGVTEATRMDEIYKEIVKEIENGSEYESI